MSRGKGRGRNNAATYDEGSRSDLNRAISGIVGEEAMRYLVRNPKMLPFMLPILLMLSPLIVGLYAITRIPWGSIADRGFSFAGAHPKLTALTVGLLGLTLILPPELQSPLIGFFTLVGVFGIGFVLVVAGLNVVGINIGYAEALRRAVTPFAIVLQTFGLTNTVATSEILPTKLWSPGTSRPESDRESTDDRTHRELAVPVSEVVHAEKNDYTKSALLLGGPSPVTLQSNYSTLVLGEPGAGKTTTMNLLIRQMNTDPDDPIIVFDFKGEFDDPILFGDREILTLSADGGTVTWNVFREVRDETEYDEIAEMLINDEGGENDFFNRAARTVLRAGFVYLHRDRPHPTNRDLVEFFARSSDDIRDDFAEHDDLRTAADYLDRPNDDALLTVRQFVDQVFTGDFGTVGGFSVRDYVEDPNGRVLVLQTVISKFERTKPAVRFLVDWAIKYGLADSTRNSFYILDELQRLPNLNSVEMLTGVGRAQNAQAILGIQGISQLDASYNEELADAIKAGSNQEILMRPGDPASVEYIQNSLGSEIVHHKREAPGFGQYNVQQEERQYLSERELKRFDTGEAIITAPDGFVHGQIKQWEDLSRTEQNRLTTD